MREKIMKLIVALTICMMVFTSNVFAAEVAAGDADMQLVRDEVCNIKFGKYGEFKKFKSDFNAEDKSINLKFVVKNNAEIKTPTPSEPTVVHKMKPSRIVFLIDTSDSMTLERPGADKTRKERVLTAVNSIKDAILKEGKGTSEIGIVDFATSKEPEKEGTDEDAVVMLEPTSDEATINAAIEKVREHKMGPRTDIQVGLETADKLLTKVNDDKDKIIILLTDAIPNTARGVVVDPYTSKSITPTINTVRQQNELGINLYSVLINMTNEEIKIAPPKHDGSRPTYREVSELIFGTTTQPVAGPVFYVGDEYLEQNLVNDIFDNLTYTETIPGSDTTGTVEQYVLNDIVIKDYFPKEIIDNFDLMEVSKATKGSMNFTVNPVDNSITWTIANLNPQEVGEYEFKIKLKEKFDSEILNKDLPTNKNVTIEYKENNKPGEPKENSDCPAVRLTVEPKKPDVPPEKPKKPENPPEVPKDVPKGPIPKTGSYGYIFTATATTLLGGVAGILFYLSKRKY